MRPEFEWDVVVVGGAGHVGFPLAVAFASRGLRTLIHDINAEAIAGIVEGRAPFLEPGIEEPLAEGLASGRLDASTDPSTVATAANVVLVVGTPVDQYLSPDPAAVPKIVADLVPCLRQGQLVILRSTVFPGVTRRVAQVLAHGGAEVDLAFCPERIAEGNAMTELFSLPQIVSGYDARAVVRAGELFAYLTESIIELTPEEAELSKLFTNSWRYIKFAAANQYYMMATDLGLDFDRIRTAMRQDYPRAADLPGAGFAAGPCLFKDTMQLASVTGGAFALGHAAMLVNEGLPDYVVRRLEQEHDLPDLTVGILGMAFKAESDDRRSSLSYRLKRLLAFRARNVLTTDPYVRDDPELHDFDKVVEQSDLLIIGAPHTPYRSLVTDTPVIDIWNLIERNPAL